MPTWLVRRDFEARPAPDREGLGRQQAQGRLLLVPEQRQPRHRRVGAQGLGALAPDLRGLRARAMLMIGFGGLRRSEIVGLDLGPDQTQEGESKSGGYWRVN